MNSIDKKIKNFFIANWWLLWTAIALGLVLNIYSIYSTLSIQKDFVNEIKIVDKISQRVVLLGYDGRAVGVKTTSIDAKTKGFKENLSKTIAYYLVWDYKSLTQDFTKNIKSFKEFYASSAKAKEFAKNYFNKKYLQGLYSLKDYFNIIIHLANSKKLPDTITVLKTAINDYSVDGDNFKITISYTVGINSYNYASNTTIRKEGVITYNIEGVFKAEYSNGINPLGIIFTKIRTKYVSV